MRATAFAIAGLLLASPAIASDAGTASPKPPPPPAVDLSTLPESAVVRPPGGDKPHPVVARLIADREVVAPGETFRLGVLLEQQPGWHTYWRSPGDIGLPTNVTWKLPDGATAAPYAYPVPQRFELQGIVSYGYEDQVLLFSEVTLPASQPEGAITVAAAADWLVCEVNCIPGAAELSLPLNVGKGGGPGPLAPLFDHYAAQHPTPPLSVQAFAAETTPHASAFRPEEPFKVAVLLTPTGDQKLPAPAEGATWPVFTPIVSSDVVLFGATVKPTPEGGLVAVLEGETLPVEPLPERTAVGGLFQIEVGGETIRTEITTEVPWVGKGTAVAPSTSPLWQLVGGAPQVPGPTTTGDAPTAPPVLQVAPAAPASEVSLPLMLVFAFIGGLLLNVMPCVLPVLTLKLYGLVAHGHHEARERQVAGVAYTAGILASFWVLAGLVLVAQAWIGGVGWGFQFQYPAYVAGLGAIVFAFALSMFGVFELPVVGADSMANASARGGVGGHFMTGVFATLLGTPCSAPFLGPAIGFAFSQSAPMIALFFTIVGLGLAFPFLIVAFVPALFRLLPKPGPWMDTFKQLMGFTLVATTVWLVSVLSSQVGAERTIGYLAFLGAVSFGAWIFGHFGGLAASPGRQLGAALAGIAAAVAGGYAFLDLRFEEAVAAAPSEVTHDGLAFDEEIPWQPFSEAAVASLAGKPVFIDFTAEWCLTCKVNENTILETQAVREAMQVYGVVPLKADWTRRDPVISEWLARYGRAGVPFYLVLPADPTAQPIPLPEVITQDMVIRAMEQASSGGKPAMLIP